jgi:opacity protein-like surface antigen
MQGKKRLAIIGALAMLSLDTSTFAAMSVPFGWYLEGNVGSTHVSNQRSTRGANSSNSGIGGNVNLGYKFMPYFGMDLGYTQYAGTTFKSMNTKLATSTNYSYQIAGKGILPISSSGFELFAKLGVGRVATKLSFTNSAHALGLGGSSNHSATGFYYALGAQYYFMPELAVVGQWAQAYGNNTTGNFGLLSIGASFIFD